MGGQFGPPIPGRYGPRPVQGGIASPQQGTVPYQTPMANQFLEGVNQFIGDFQGVQEAEKQKARQEFFEGVQMMQLGLKVDMKKLARAARKGELPFDFGGESQVPQQGAPVPGGGAPPGMMPGGGAGGSVPGASAPVPGGGGGPGFFGRLGRAMTQPFQDAAQRNAPIPGNAGVYQALGQMQQRAQMQNQLQGLEGQKQLELAKMAVEYLKTGDPEIAAKLAANKMLDLPETLQSIFTISSMMGKGDADKSNEYMNNGLRATYDQLTGVSKAATERQQRIDQFARSIQDGYDNLEDAVKAATSVVDNGKLPEGLQPTKAFRERMKAITDTAMDLRAQYRGLNTGTAFSIATKMNDPLATPEERAAALAPLDNLKTLTDERLEMARAQLDVSLANLGIRKKETAHDDAVRAALTDYLISTSNMANGMLDYSKARQDIQRDANSGLMGEEFKDLVPEMLRYLDIAQRANIETVQMQALLRLAGLGGSSGTPGPSGPSGPGAPLPMTGNGTIIPTSPPPP